MRLALLLAAALLAIGCGQPAPGPFPDAPVIIISVDTLRADRLPVYGYNAVDTPYIDAFASESIVYEQAWATVPVTLPSHASLFTGKPPSGHGVRENAGFRLPDSSITLAEVLRERGYQTGAAVSSMVLRKSTGIGQGFDFYDDRPGSGAQNKTYAERPGPETTASASSYIRAQNSQKPFFFWLHLYEPHTPYAAPAEYASRYTHPYDGEVAWSDKIVGDFLAGLKDAGVYDRSIIILLSDHGEGLGDHGEEEHGLFVYRESLQVPLIIRLPGADMGGTRIAEAVGLTDVFPTVLNLLGQESVATAGMALLAGGSLPQRPIYSEAMTAWLYYGWRPLYSIVHKNRHYIEAGQELSAFDLENDFSEINDLKPDHFPPEVARAINEHRGDHRADAEVSQADRDMLASLGYVGDFQMGDEVQDLSAKALLDIHQSIAGAQQMIHAGRLAEAEALLTERLQRYPSLLGARVLLGQALYLSGKYEAAEYVCTEGLAVSPDNERLLLGLAAVKLALGKTDETLILAEKCMERAPLLCGRRLIPLLQQHGLSADAVRLAALAAPHDPVFSFAWMVYPRVDAADPGAVARLMAETRRDQKLDLDSFVDGSMILAEYYARDGNTDLAAAIWSNNLREAPGHGPSRINLYKYDLASGRGRQAQERLDLWLETFPSREHYLQVARLMEELGRLDAAGFYREQAAKYP